MPETPERFFAERGFALTFAHPSEDKLEAIYVRDGTLSRTEYQRLRKSGAVGPVVADLRSTKDPRFDVPTYGTGATEPEAARRAMERWVSEQRD